MTSHKELLIATRQFAQERVWLSWWHIASTLGIALALVAIVCSELHLAGRFLASTVLGLVFVRLFVLYHDFQHGAILRGSRVGKLLMETVGLILLTPPSSWNRSHNHHHSHNSKLSTPDIGTYPLMTVDEFQRASRWRQVMYAIQRHPLTMALGYLTVFLYGMCIRPFIANPRRHWDGALSVACHAALLVWVGCDEVDDLLLATLLPFGLASAVGAYLFYAQHNFPGVQINPVHAWDYTTAALDSSSYITMGPLMNWFTANIGYHHVHHLNARIPFYRLPEAMQALPDLQMPGTSSLQASDIQACLRLKLWDPDSQQLVPWSHLRKAA
ncbi:MAG: fatty acid desaturase [Planctomycetaceae bacterium]|nr:fatty acid desaturase [Planctomycetaceae bacterium]